MTGDNDTITLKDAASHFGFGIATLRAEADRGRLTIYKIGKRLYTTPADVREMSKRVDQGLSRNSRHDGVGVYVVGFDNYVKIGRSDDLSSRLSQIQRNLPTELIIYATFRCSTEDERTLHRKFKEYRLRGEWFRLEGDLAAWIKRGFCG